MPSRAEIEAKLDKERTKLVDHFRALSAEDLARPCTKSEVDGAGGTNPVGFDFKDGREAAIGGVILTNAYHEAQHRSWVEEGLAAT